MTFYFFNGLLAIEVSPDTVKSVVKIVQWILRLFLDRSFFLKPNFISFVVLLQFLQVRSNKILIFYTVPNLFPSSSLYNSQFNRIFFAFDSSCFFDFYTVFFLVYFQVHCHIIGFSHTKILHNEIGSLVRTGICWKLRERSNRCSLLKLLILEQLSNR